MLQTLQHGGRRIGMATLEIPHPVQLGLFFGCGRAGELERLRDWIAPRITEGIDAHNRQITGVLKHLVMHGFVLNPATLIAGLHGAQYPPALGNTLELSEYRFFDQFGQFFKDVRALVWILVDR